DKRGVAGSYNNLGINYREEGNFAEALKNYLASLKIREEIKDKDGIATCFSSTCLNYFQYTFHW
ncbi:MAG TPA: tetratricopeptide repeat protein, partial [Bacteroidia bacterium]|nr:tetratricopeptide repeat protein [Bacteroidia bacterium]